jgi:hypothetical protein
VLEKALSEQGLTIRKDSSLCKSFIEGTLDASYTPEGIAYLCGLHRYLYEYTDYSARCAAILPRIANALSSSLGGYNAAWEYVTTVEAPLIKMAILQENPVPQVWPWMASSETTSTNKLDESEPVQAMQQPV